MQLRGTLFMAAALMATTAAAVGVKPTSSELKRARDWGAANLSGGKVPPFSFTYGGMASTEFIASWKAESTSRKLDAKRTERTTAYTDPATGLVLTCKAVEYRDYPTVEWTLYFKNTGKADTPIIENIRALDMQVKRQTKDAEFTLHHNQGSTMAHDDFQPFTTPLPTSGMRRLASEGGRPMSSTMPYYNLTWGDEGLIVSISWLSDWYSELQRDGDTGLHITAGQQVGHFKLHPGEQVRTPMIVLQFWKGGDRVRSHNVWRRWMIAHSLPTPGGKPFPIMTSSGIPDTRGNLITYESEELEGIEWHVKRKLPIDIWWRDAAWYPCGDHWYNVGTWQPDPVRFPRGLKPMSDAAHKAGMKLTVWFELERAVVGSWVYVNHPEWLLGEDGQQKLLDFGNKDAWNWAIEFIDKFIKEQGIDMYRQDFNIDPSSNWRSKEPEDRQGITETHYIEGMIAFWDELKRRFPNMPLDHCAGGGRRNVVEMMRRGVPLSKTDDAGGTSSSQGQLMGLAPWFPYYGAGIGSDNLYELRSNMAPWSAVAYDCRREDLNWDRIRLHLQRCHELAPYMLGDFYPLTPYGLAEDVWAAWQFDQPEKGVGMVQAFRRPMSTDSFKVFKLRGLEAGATYELKNIDSGETERTSGKDLMAKGLRVGVADHPAAAIIEYRKVRK